MKNKWHDIIRKRLAKYSKECLSCLYPPTGYEWGCQSRKYKRNTLALVNKIVKGIPVSAWPVMNDGYESYKIVHGNWNVCLGWDCDGNKLRTIDLKYRRDDHTAWCIEGKGKFVDYDIGGS